MFFAKEKHSDVFCLLPKNLVYEDYSVFHVRYQEIIRNNTNWQMAPGQLVWQVQEKHDILTHLQNIVTVGARDEINEM